MYYSFSHVKVQVDTEFSILVNVVTCPQIITRPFHFFASNGVQEKYSITSLKTSYIQCTGFVTIDGEKYFYNESVEYF